MHYTKETTCLCFFSSVDQKALSVETASLALLDHPGSQVPEESAVQLVTGVSKAKQAPKESRVLQ